MFCINNIEFINQETIYYLKSYSILLIISIISATPLLKRIISKLRKTKLKINEKEAEAVRFIFNE